MKKEKASNRTKSRIEEKNRRAVRRIPEKESLPSLSTIRDQKEILSALIDSIQDEVWFADTKKNIGLANPSALHAFGLKAGESISVESVAESIETYRSDGTRRPVPEAPLLRALEGEVIRNEESVVRTPATGELRHRQVSAAPVRDAHGRIIGSVAVARDITDEKRTENAVRASENKYRGLFDHMNEVMAIDELLYDDQGNPSDWRILDVNPTFVKKTGKPRDQIIGRLASEIYGTPVPALFLSRFGDLVRTGKSVQFEEYFAPMQAHVLVSAFPLGDARFATLTTDITDAKRAEARLKASLNALTRIHALSRRLVETEGLQPLLQEIMEAAVEITGAERGTLQLFEGESLRIVAHHGHKQSFLEFFESAETQTSVCGEAMRRGERVIIPDVETDSLFAGTPSLAVLREACVRAVQSTPILTRTGALLGILTTQWNMPYSPDEHDLWRLDLLARQAADLIEQAKAEEALRESEQRYRALAETSPDAIVVHRGGVFLYANPAALSLYDAESLVQLKKRSVFDLIHPDDLQRTIERIRQVEQGLKIPIREVRLIRRDGREVYVEAYATTVMYGRERAIQAVLHDITERKLAEQEMTRLASFPILNPNPVVEVDLNINVLFANPSAHKLFPDLEKRGSKHPFVAGCGNPKNAPFDPGNSIQRDVMVGERWYNQTIHYVEEAQRIRIYGLDITKRKQAEEKLRLANEELEMRVLERTRELAIRADQLRALAGELTLAEQRERRRLAKVLHDHLQQLLVGAKFRLTVLGRGGDDVLKQGIKEIENLIDESIASSRSLTAELSPPILHEAGLNAGLEWLARRMADTQGLFVDLETETIGSLPDDLAILLFESVRELLFNVVKHADTRSACVNLRRIQESLQLTVSDQGAGFDPKTMPQAGEAGGGFGLFGIRERLKLFGGSLEIESSPGQGSRLVISVPITRHTAVESQSTPVKGPPEELGAERIPAPVPGRKIRVLLADDHTVVREGIAKLLSIEPDIEIIGKAGDGQETVDLAANLLPDVILMDMNMPKLNGVEATRIIHNEFPDICIIGLSMFEEAERAQAMRDAGAANYVTKSGPTEDLINAIRTGVRPR